MARTTIHGRQVTDGSIESVDLSADLNNTINGKADSNSLATVATTGDYTDLTNTPSIPSALDDLSDVVITTPSTDQVIKYDGSNWINAAAPAAGASSLDELSDVVITSAVKGQFIVHDGTEFVNSNTIEASGAAVKPLIIKGAASQTANLFEAQNSAGTNIFALSSDAQTIVFDRSGASNAIVPTGSYVGGVTFRGWNGTGYNRAAGIYAAIDGTPGASNDMPGRIEFYTTADGQGEFVAERMRLNSSGNLGIGNGPSNPLARLHVDLGSNGGTPAVPGTKGILVKGAVSQTANLIEVQNSGGTLLSSISSAGAAYFASNITTVGTLTFGIAGSGMALKNGGYNGVSLGRSSSAGESGLALGSYVSCGSNAMVIGWGGGGTGRQIIGLSTGEVGIGTSTPGAQLHLIPKATTMKGLVVQGAASQTANLLEVQDSAGTALFTIDKDGSVAAGTVPAARVTGLATVATSGDYTDLSNTPTGLATETYVDAAISNLVNSAPATLDTLNELAAALGDDPNFATTISTQIGLKADSSSLATVATSGDYNDLINTPSAGASDLDGLSDVTLTSSASGEFLKYDGSGWVNSNTINASASKSGLVIQTSATVTGEGEDAFLVKNSSNAAKFKVRISTNAANNYTIIGDKLGIGSNERPSAHLNAHASSGSPIFQMTRGAESPTYENGFRIVYTGTDVIQKLLPASGAIKFYTGGGNTNRFQIASNGLVTSLYGMAVNSQSTSTTPLTVTRPASADNYGFVVRNSSNMRLVGIGRDSNYSGGHNYDNSVSSALIEIGSTQYGHATLAYNETQGTLSILSKSSTNALELVPEDGGYGLTKLTVVRAPSFTANVGKWNFNVQHPTGSASAINFNAYSGVSINLADSDSLDGSLHVKSNAAARKGVVVQAHASQTANLLEAQDSSGAALAVIQSDGTVHAKRYIETAANAFNTTLSPSSGTLTVDSSLGNAVLGALDASVTTWAFTNAPTDNSKVTTVTAVLEGNTSYTYGDACSVNGTAVTDGIKWSGGSAPASTAGTDIITFIIVRDSAGDVRVFGSATTNFS